MSPLIFSDILPKISTDDYYNYKLSEMNGLRLPVMLTDASGYLTLSATCR